MPVIILETTIYAPRELCFDLSRSIELHMESTSHTGERAIAGRMSGLIEKNETVTWRAKHLGVWQNLTSKITEMDAPNFFADEMVKGAFKSFRHEHSFIEIAGGTLMVDTFVFESPLGILGKLADALFLTNYIRRFLIQRNTLIKKRAETIHNN